MDEKKRGFERVYSRTSFNDADKAAIRNAALTIAVSLTGERHPVGSDVAFVEDEIKKAIRGLLWVMRDGKHYRFDIIG